MIWSALGLAFTYCLELLPFGRELVGGSHVVQISDTRMLLHDYKWYELLGRWILIPVPYQLWFIRVLFIYNLAYPWIRWCVLNRIGRWIFFGIAVLMWLGTMGFVFIEGEGLLFFSLGVWMQKTDFNIEQARRWLNPSFWGIAFVFTAVIKTTIALIGQPFPGTAVFPILILLHKVMVVSGLIACWFGLDSLVSWCMKRKWFVWLSAFSFMIYAIHAPLVAYCIDPMLRLCANLTAPGLSAFFLLPLIIIAFAVGTGFLLRLITPKVYGFLTGGRGL